MLTPGHTLTEFPPSHSPCSMVLIGKERCGSSRRNQSDCRQKFEEPGSSIGKLRSAPREGGWICFSRVSRVLATRRISNRKRHRRRSTSPVVGRRSRPSLEALETRQLLSTYAVTNTNDSGAGSLRQAIINADGDSSPDDIVFNIPASTDPNLDVPVGDTAHGNGGFDPGTQTWRIKLVTPLPVITNTVSIDGYSQAHDGGVPYRYSSLTSAVQTSSSVVVRRAGPSRSQPLHRCLRKPQPRFPGIPVREWFKPRSKPSWGRKT